MKNIISEKQLAANRANAKNSTGPLTDEGKNRSSLNSLKHGLLANRLIPGEDQKLYEEFYQDWINDLNPLGMQQVVIADQIIMTAFKIMRCHQLEASLWTYRVVRESAFTHLYTAEGSTVRNCIAKISNEPILKVMGMAFAHDSENGSAALKLSTIEQRLISLFHKLLLRFEQIKGGSDEKIL